jgi:hypothetical protein
MMDLIESFALRLPILGRGRIEGTALGDYHVLGQPATWGVSADYRF